MRPITLGAIILAGGTLLALPFRKSDDNEPAQPARDAASTDFLDDESLDMLVREVTEGVEVPSVYQAQTDYAPQPSAAPARHLPLTYEDLAVPVDRDPYYENRFNATAAVADRSQDFATAQTSDDQRLSDLERTFSQSRFVESEIARLQGTNTPAGGLSPKAKPPTVQQPFQGSAPVQAGQADAKFVSSEKAKASIRQQRQSVPELRDDRQGHSVLSQLPPPEGTGADGAEAADRQMHWIRQPD